MLLRFLAFFSVRAARRLDQHRFARKYVVALTTKRAAERFERTRRHFYKVW